MGGLADYTTAQLREEIFKRCSPNFPPEGVTMPEGVVTKEAPAAEPAAEEENDEIDLEAIEQHITGELNKMIKALKKIASVSDPERAAETVVNELCGMLEADRATIFRVDPDSGDLLIKLAAGMAPMRIPRSVKSIATGVADSCEPLIIDDVQTHPLFDPTNDKKTGYTTKNMLCVPATDETGKAVAVLQVVNKLDGDFGELDVVLAQNVATMSGVILRNCDDFVGALAAERRATGLLDILSALKGELNANSFMFTINRRVQEITDAEKATFFVADHHKKLLMSATTDSGVQIKIPITAGLVGSCVEEQDFINIPDAYQDPRFNKANDEKSGFKTRSILCAPIKTKEPESGKEYVFAVVQLINKRGGPFTKDDETILREISSLISDKVAPETLLATFHQGSKAGAGGEAVLDSEVPGARPSMRAKPSPGMLPDAIGEDEEEEEG